MPITGSAKWIEQNEFQSVISFSLKLMMLYKVTYPHHPRRLARGLGYLSAGLGFSWVLHTGDQASAIGFPWKMSLYSLTAGCAPHQNCVCRWVFIKQKTTKPCSCELPDFSVFHSTAFSVKHRNVPWDPKPGCSLPGLLTALSQLLAAQCSPLLPRCSEAKRALELTAGGGKLICLH